MAETLIAEFLYVKWSNATIALFMALQIEFVDPPHGCIAVLIIFEDRKYIFDSSIIASSFKIRRTSTSDVLTDTLA